MDSLVSDHRGVAVELLSSATDVIVVLDNHGLEARAGITRHGYIGKETRGTCRLDYFDFPAKLAA